MGTRIVEVLHAADGYAERRKGLEFLGNHVPQGQVPIRGEGEPGKAR